MRLDQAPVFALQSQSGNHLVLSSPEGAVAHVWVLEEDIVRVLVLPQGRLNMPRTWTVAPGLENLPVEGRDRFDLSGFSLPAFELTQDGARLHISTSAIRLTLALEGFFCRWESRHRGQWHPTAVDRPTQSYNFGWWDERVYHYLQRAPGEVYFGSGMGLVNNLWGVILPAVATPTGVFLLRQYMLTIPDELLEAARMDNASEWRIYWKIVLPLAAPAMAVLAIFSFMWRWNDFLWPLIVLSKSEHFTLQLALNSFQGELNTQWHYLLAMTVITLIPISLVFTFLQKYIATGIAGAGVK